jgi:hypothetical protein
MKADLLIKHKGVDDNTCFEFQDTGFTLYALNLTLQESVWQVFLQYKRPDVLDLGVSNPRDNLPVTEVLKQS